MILYDYCLSYFWKNDIQNLFSLIAHEAIKYYFVKRYYVFLFIFKHICYTS
jgi:hypothetical protein